MDLTFILAVAPPLLIVAYIIKADRFPEPKGTCFLTFVAGTIIIVPAAILNDKLIVYLSLKNCFVIFEHVCFVIFQKSYVS